ncbi:hypothetical protein EDD27_3948 [Nonomuraea polychroma]|uniref:Uncharacterized protein n=1 Tax=Nonomuraea polychroma TaxID=46176 RepID=A0A438M6U8_9ACTN|nr:hypothetical protein [Nonomuraea polychroma]RVX41417.1 hypothetical protein EDD27_3948 [Nonomuraea polychroma]
MQRLSGLFVGAMIGAVFIHLSANDVHNSLLAIVLRVPAIAVLAGVAVMWLLGVKAVQSGDVFPVAPDAGSGLFDRTYALIVAAEAALFLAGLALLRGWGPAEQATVAWLTFMAGVHFIVLAPRWRARLPLIPGVILVVLGVAGFTLAATMAPAWAPVMIGALSGMTVLVGSAACCWRTLTSIRQAGSSSNS